MLLLAALRLRRRRLCSGLSETETLFLRSAQLQGVALWLSSASLALILVGGQIAETVSLLLGVNDSTGIQACTGAVPHRPPYTDTAVRQLMPANAKLPTARTAVLTSLQAPDGSGLLDHALVLRFPAPRSFTGGPKCVQPESAEGLTKRVEMHSVTCPCMHLQPATWISFGLPGGEVCSLPSPASLCTRPAVLPDLLQARIAQSCTCMAPQPWCEQCSAR